MRRYTAIIFLLLVSCVAVAQDNGVVMKPNYRKIARVVKSPASPYFLDSLVARFDRCDTSLTVDGFRCLYYSCAAKTLKDAYRIYDIKASRFGRQSPQANTAWTQYQMLVTAIWSTGDGSKRKPLHVICVEDATYASKGYDTPLWFKIKGKRKFCVSPQEKGGHETYD